MRRFSLPPAMYVSLAGFLTIASLGEVAVACGRPWLFPSLGPTAFLMFYAPLSDTASPRHTIGGHGIGIACGWISLWITGLTMAGAADPTTMGHARVVAAAMALSATGGLMVLTRTVHPPAGATTLIIALGLITRAEDLVILELAILVLSLEALIINRLAGIDYPIWNPRGNES
jgi:CBS domain-containing membrane protein